LGSYGTWKSGWGEPMGMAGGWRCLILRVGHVFSKFFILCHACHALCEPKKQFGSTRVVLGADAAYYLSESIRERHKRIINMFKMPSCP